MSTASTARRHSRSRAWLRVLVLLLALLVPGAHAQAHALPVTAGISGEVAEHDVLDTALRPAARADRRNAVRARPAPPPRPAPGAAPAPRSCPPPGQPYVPHILRTVVLRC
ncbi:hypothetical protein ACQF36_31600 [Streptomyces sp. Marseille-Q5077]|uniref:hypothetical protein n=1 Tax=Streptomyces sp. Marseille-Q5077 TaxID=3418995 RepID=UPI003D0177D0